MEGASTTSTNTTSTSTDGNIDPEALKEIAKFELFAIDFKLRQQGTEHSEQKNKNCMQENLSDM